MKFSFLLILALVAGTVVCLGNEAVKASWYGEEYRGRLMANGKRFNPDRLTCASWFHPFGARLRVRSLETGRSVVVVVTDRGPSREFVGQGRMVDLSSAAFARIANRRDGLENVSIERVR